MRLLTLLIAAASLLISSPTFAQDEADDLPGLFERAYNALDVGEYETALRTIQILLAHPDFDALPEEARADAYGLAGFANLYRSDHDTGRAIEYLNEAERLGSRNPLIYLTRSFANMSEDKPALAAQDMMRADRLATGLLNGLRGRDFFVLMDMLAQSDSEEAVEVYPLFVEYVLKRWVPENPFETTEYVRYHAARIEVAEGDLIKAGRLVEGLEFAETRLRVQIEREFEAFWIEDEQALRDHIREGAEHTIRYFGALADENPGYIEPVALKAQGYTQLGQPELAFAELEAAREQVFNGELINDVGEQLTWLLNDMATAAEQQGHFEQAVSLMDEAASLSEFNSANVSQRINLAFMLALNGQAERALEQLEQVDVEQTSAHGKAMILTTRICAEALGGVTREFDAELQELSEAGLIISGFHQYALACIDDRDEAAALLIERLNHPAARADALVSLQEYLDVEGEYKSPFRPQLDAHEDAVIARPEVAAAINRAGRIIEVGVTY